MIELGKAWELEIIRKKDFGVYLAEKEGDEATVLLPKGQVPKGAGIGDKVKVFTHKNPSDRLTATTRKLRLQMGGTVKLKVEDVAKVGALLDMGLGKDPLLLSKKQTHPVRRGGQCFITLYMDKSRRLAATMRVYSHMSNQSPHRAEDWVTGTVHGINETIGVSVAADHRYHGPIPKKEPYGRLREGDTVQARVTGVREDRKLDLRVREKSYVQMGIGAGKVLKVMDQLDSMFPSNDKAKPGVIIYEFSMGKNAFRRAVDRLLKEGKIRITDKIVEHA